jgi:hypothetical protein
MFHTSGISIGTVAAVAIGSAALSAGGAVAASAMTNSANSKMAAGNSSAAKKFQKFATRTANEGYGDEMAAWSKLNGAQGALSANYMTGVNSAITAYQKGVKSSIGKYDASVKEIDSKWDKNVSDFETKSKTVSEDSASQAIKFNEDNAQKYIDFANTLSDANLAKSKQMAFEANPYWERQIDAMGRFNLDALEGRIGADRQGQIARLSAESSGRNGSVGGSEMARNLTFRDLGIDQYKAGLQAQQDSRALNTDIYSQMIQGKQVQSEKIADWMGLSSKQVLDANIATNMSVLDAKNTGLNRMFTAAGNIFDKRFNMFTNSASFSTTAQGNQYGQDSATARSIAAGEAAAAAERTNASLGIASTGLAGSYATNANAANSSIAAANMVNSTANNVSSGLMTYATYKGLQGGGTTTKTTAPPADTSATGYQH